MAEGNRIYTLLNYAITDSNVFSPNETINNELVQVCFELCNRDNVCSILNNYKGSLCSTYPGQLIIPTKQKLEENVSNSLDMPSAPSKEFQELVTRGRFARTRSRFPIPVLLIGDKFVCRSSTLARSPEIYTRTGLQYFTQSDATLQTENGDKNNCSSQNNVIESNGHLDTDKLPVNNGGSCNNLTETNGNHGSKIQKPVQNNVNGAEQNKEWLLDKMRKTDIDILHSLKVNVICDLMVENKKVKYGLNVTSSEKVDRQNRYRDFCLMSTPYPGCEFFADYSNNNYKGAGLKFDWKQDFVDAEFQIPEDFADLHGIDWKDYMQWDLVTLTQNYFKLLLKCLILPNSSGILLHCISGWDRTPLFVSLLRLSLWADGLIHQSLNAEEIVYLTLAYDWLLFSHQFTDRINKREEIMHFCFEFLHDMVSQEYSLLPELEKDPNLFNGSKEVKDHVLSTENEVSLNGVHKDLNKIQFTDNETKFLEGTDYEEIYSHGECEDNLSTPPQCNECGNEPIVNLQDVEKCLNCMIESVSCSHCSNNLVVANNATVRKKHLCKCASLSKNMSNSSAAILPLSTSDNLSPEFISPIHISSQELDKNGKFPPDDSDESSEILRSSSFETLKNGDLNYHNGSPTETSVVPEFQLKNDHSSSEISVTKSEPIPVPKNSSNNKPNGAHFSIHSSLGSSISNPPFTFEPGSWQMISTSPPGISAVTESNSSASSAVHSLRNNSFNSKPYTLCSCSTELAVKLEKRREKLKMAYNIMIPAYCAVVKKQKQQQEQSGFSALMGSLVHFVKRT